MGNGKLVGLQRVDGLKINIKIDKMASHSRYKGSRAYILSRKAFLFIIKRENGTFFFHSFYFATFNFFQ